MIHMDLRCTMMPQHHRQADDIVPREIAVGGAMIKPLPGRYKKRKIVYYHPGTGEPTCPLPADKYHMNLFLSRGFTLEPPLHGAGICPVCGKKVKRLKQHYKLAHEEVNK